MHIDIETGLLREAIQVPSPNCDERPVGTEINLLVIHGISLPPGEFGGPWIDALFTKALPADAHPYFQEICGLEVSSHLLVRRNGRIVQYVPFNRRAWHAGVSVFAGRHRCNDFSIGVELEGADDVAYEGTQYEALAALTRALMQAYPGITTERVAGHCDIAPGRKTDPGPAFDWERFRANLPRHGQDNR